MRVVNADVAVVGGGIVGLATAYELARRGVKVALVERGFVGGGSSTRNAARFRVQFSNVENTRYAKEAVKYLLSISRRLRWNPIIRIGGYLWLFRDERGLKAFEEANNSIWRRLGVGVRFLSMDEVEDRYPYINAKLYVGAAYAPQDGELHHDFLIYGYYEALKDLGAFILDNVGEARVVASNGRVVGVESSSASVKANVVVVAAGAWTPQILRGLGVELPISVVRKEIGVTIPVRHFIEPSLIVDVKVNAYIGQTLRGELIGSVEIPEEAGMKPMVNTYRWLKAWARAMAEAIPSTSTIPIMRVWSGYYDVAPDNSHVMGRVESWPKGLYVASGFGGHGLMFGPYTGKLMAEYILEGREPDVMRPFNPGRFAEGRLIREALVIG